MKMQQQKRTNRHTRRRWVLALALGVITPLAGPLTTARADDEFGDNTPYYEDDAWYDVSEWFDGNDYNPTDEAIGRWDNETYDTSEALTSTDSDNDIDWSETSFGFFSDDNDVNSSVAASDNNWFYDYYDYGYSDYSDYDNDGNFDYTATYYDYDNDGIYDSVAEYADNDSDGVYETYNFISFANTDTDQDRESQMQSKNDQKSMKSEVISRQGSIRLAKKVKTPQGTHLVVALQNAEQDSAVLVDLGSTDNYDTMPRLGQNVQVKGTAMKAGDKMILIATKVTRDGDEQSIDRSGRQFTGTVETLKTTQVQGTTRQLARIKTDDGKKLLVDMGQEGNLNLDVQEGSKVTVTGPAVKVNNRVMLIAREVMFDGESAKVQRMAMNP